MPLPFIKYASKSFFSFDSLFTCYYSKISALVPSSLSWTRVKISLFALSVRAFGHVLAVMASASDSLLDVGAEYVDTGSVVTCSSSCLAWRQRWRRQGVRPQGCLLSFQNTLQDFFPPQRKVNTHIHIHCQTWIQAATCTQVLLLWQQFYITSLAIILNQSNRIPSTHVSVTAN